MERLLSLAAGTVPELSPPELVRVAAAGGWPATGLWYDAETWTSTTTVDVVHALDDTGTLALDLEPIFVTPGGDHGDVMIDIAAEIGARHILVVGLGVDDAALTSRLQSLGERAAAVGVTCALEFGPLFATPDLAAAVSSVERAGHAGLSILIDALHLARSGGTPADVSTVDAALLPYVQVCDATAAPMNDLRTDALDDRLLIGDGELPVTELLAAVPATSALSVELRSARLRDEHEPADRARLVYESTLRGLGS